MGVPRHLQVPLSIDTSISYDLDRSMFPGLDDPRYRHEPVLLIAPERDRYFSQIRGNQRVQIRAPNTQITHSTADCSGGYKTELLDDLLGIMDINTKDLIIGLKNTKEYLSLVEDVIQGLPHSDELYYIEGPKENYAPVSYNQNPRACCCHGGYMNTSAPVYSCVSKEHRCSDKATTTATRMNNMTLQSELYKKDSQYVGSVKADYFPHLVPPNHMSTVNLTDCRKRKRVDNSLGVGITKKSCFGNDFMDYVSHYQKGWLNYTNGIAGTHQSHGRQVRVM